MSDISNVRTHYCKINALYNLHSLNNEAVTFMVSARV